MAMAQVTQSLRGKIENVASRTLAVKARSTGSKHQILTIKHPDGGSKMG